MSWRLVKDPKFYLSLPKFPKLPKLQRLPKLPKIKPIRPIKPIVPLGINMFGETSNDWRASG